MDVGPVDQQSENSGDYHCAVGALETSGEDYRKIVTTFLNFWRKKPPVRAYVTARFFFL